MVVLYTVQDIHDWCAARRLSGRSLGLVPTMGYLHEGHLALVDAARHDNDDVIATIFVNPTQFAAHEDLSTYPRDLERDYRLLRAHECSAVFAPSVEEMYPTGFATRVSVDSVSADFEGAIRPTHFDGVALVVTRLLCLSLPTTMYLGQKDLQQTAVLRRLVTDLGLPTSVVVVPTVRDADGLAKSSRNVYLRESDRTSALVLSRCLGQICNDVAHGITAVDQLLQAARQVLHTEPNVQLEYLAIVDPVTMQPLLDIQHAENPACIIAARVGSTRLIDNCFVYSGL